MLFNSDDFLFLFLPLILGVFYTLVKVSSRLALATLLAGSMIFYCWWNIKDAALLLALTAINYGLGVRLQERPSRNLLAAAVGLNLAALFLFKYSQFAIDNITALLGTRSVRLGISLPLGMSFFIFQKIAFLSDSYSGKAKNTRPLFFWTFVWFFPQLIAGPIVHYATLFPQFRRIQTLYKPENIFFGLSIFGIGLFKKCVIADTLAGDCSVFRTYLHLVGHPSFVTAWVGLLGYTFQIYFDFSGYSDMAVGLARLFGIRLPVNFWSPYKSTSIIDFWRRWHMTLSAFLRCYLYIPLGGNRLGPWRRHLNLQMVMILGGIWHGANWNFLLWGALHGSYLAVAHGWRGMLRGLPWHPWVFWPARLAAWAITFISVAFAWAFFMVPNFGEALSIIKGVTGLNGLIVSPRLAALLNVSATNSGVKVGPVPLLHPESVLAIAGAAAVAFLMPNTYQLMRPIHPAWRVGSAGVAKGSVAPRPLLAVLLALVTAVGIAFVGARSPFIYYNF